MPRRKYVWEALSDEQLLKRRLSSLRVTVEGTWLEDCLNSLHEELGARGIRLRPHAWISSEWFSPDRKPGIAIPFYLAHPRLMKLEKKMMLDVEGGAQQDRFVGGSQRIPIRMAEELGEETVVLGAPVRRIEHGPDVVEQVGVVEGVVVRVADGDVHARYDPPAGAHAPAVGDLMVRF